jgi:hypothetical protein
MTSIVLLGDSTLESVTPKCECIFLVVNMEMQVCMVVPRVWTAVTIKAGQYGNDNSQDGMLAHDIMTMLVNYWENGELSRELPKKGMRTHQRRVEK